MAAFLFYDSMTYGENMGSVNTQLLEGTHGNIKKDLKVGRCIKLGEGFYVNSLPLIPDPIKKIKSLEGKAVNPNDSRDGGNILGLLIESIKEQQSVIESLGDLVESQKKTIDGLKESVESGSAGGTKAIAGKDFLLVSKKYTFSSRGSSWKTVHTFHHHGTCTLRVYMSFNADGYGYGQGRVGGSVFANTGRINFHHVGTRNYEKNYTFKPGDVFQVRISSSDFRKGTISITGYVYAGNTWEFI